MEEDRAQTDLGIAADIEEAQRHEDALESQPPAEPSVPSVGGTQQPPKSAENVVKQPKKLEPLGLRNPGVPPVY